MCLLAGDCLITHSLFQLSDSQSGGHLTPISYYSHCCFKTSLDSESESELLYDWRFTANQFFLATSTLRLTNSHFIFHLNTCGYSPYVTSSLTRGWVCSLQLLLVLASAVILRSESRRACGHILLFQIRDFPFRRLLRLAG
jgi:hypothetical protein